MVHENRDPSVIGCLSLPIAARPQRSCSRRQVLVSALSAVPVLGIPFGSLLASGIRPVPKIVFSDQCAHIY